jgi:hypothetical protein
MRQYKLFFEYLAIISFITLSAGTVVYAQLAAQQFQVNCQVSFGLLDWSHTSLLNYVEPITSTATKADSITINIPQSSTNNTFSFSGVFSADTNGSVVILQDITNPVLSNPIGMGIHVSAGHSDRVPIAPGGCVVFRIQGQMPAIEFDNSNTSAATFRVGIIAQ